MNTLKLTQDEIQMLIESLDAVGWNATTTRTVPGEKTELGKRAAKLRAKLAAALQAQELRV